MNDSVKNMISAIRTGNTSKSLESFQSAMGERVNSALDERKIAIASQLYNTQNQDKE
jgi:hypothetical protein